MNSLEMPRRQKMFRLDDRIIEALDNIAGEGKVNAFVEGLLFDFLKRAGQIPPDAAPLPETRGGKRTGAGKKRSNDPADVEGHSSIDSGESSESRSPADVDAIEGEGND